MNISFSVFLASATECPVKSDIAVAWSCLEKAAKLNVCPAIRSLQLYYKHGVGKDTFGVTANEEKPKFYTKKREILCKSSN